MRYIRREAVGPVVHQHCEVTLIGEGDGAVSVEAWRVACAGYGCPEQAFVYNEIRESGVGLFYAVAPVQVGAEVGGGAF